MKFVVALLLFLFAADAGADGLIKLDGGGHLRLTLAPCVNPAVVPFILLIGDEPDAYKAATGRLRGREFAACWQPAPGGAFIVDEEGAMGHVPSEFIKVAPQA